MGFAGFITSGVTPAVAGALRGRNLSAQQAEEQRRYEAQQAQQASGVKWERQQAIEAAQRQAMLDALAQQAQSALTKSRAEGNAIDMYKAQHPTPPSESYQTFEGPQGMGVYGVTEGKDPRFLGKAPVKDTGGAGGIGQGEDSSLPPRGARLIDDPASGRKVWVHPAFPGRTWDAGADMGMSAGANATIADNQRSLQTVREAQRAVRDNPDAFGGLAQWTMPTSVQGVLDPKGQASRNWVSDIGSLQIKDRSGATVPQAELKRLGFVPNVNDPPQVIKDKLDRLAQWIETESRILQQQYPQARGMTVTDEAVGPQRATPAAAPSGPTTAQAAYEAWKAKQGRP